MQWFIDHHADLPQHIEIGKPSKGGIRRMLAIVNRQRLLRLLPIMLDEDEFLSRYGVRSLSKVHQQTPFTLKLDDTLHQVTYEPAESQSALFGGNSNWRGSVWFPLNYLLIEALQKYHHYFGDKLKVECPARSGRFLSLWDVATELSSRLIRLFLPDGNGNRPIYGPDGKLQQYLHWRNLLLFHEYFHGDTGVGLGANHQTGWTALVAKLIEQSGKA